MRLALFRWSRVLMIFLFRDILGVDLFSLSWWLYLIGHKLAVFFYHFAPLVDRHENRLVADQVFYFVNLLVLVLFKVIILVFYLLIQSLPTTHCIQVEIKTVEKSGSYQVIEYWLAHRKLILNLFLGYLVLLFPEILKLVLKHSPFFSLFRLIVGLKLI